MYPSIYTSFHTYIHTHTYTIYMLLSFKVYDVHTPKTHVYYLFPSLHLVILTYTHMFPSINPLFMFSSHTYLHTLSFIPTYTIDATYTTYIHMNGCLFTHIDIKHAHCYTHTVIHHSPIYMPSCTFDLHLVSIVHVSCK